MSISRRLAIDAFSAGPAKLLTWLAGERGTLPALHAKAVIDDGALVFEGDAIPYFLRGLPEYFVADVFAAGDRVAISAVCVGAATSTTNAEERHVWLARFDGESLLELARTRCDLPHARERHSSPPPEHPDYLRTLGFRPAAAGDDRLPDGERLTDGKIVLSLRPAIGQSGWMKVAGHVHVLGSYAPMGAQVWAAQRGVPLGAVRHERLADLEIVEVRDSIMASQVLSAIAEAHVSAMSGLVLRGVDLFWHVHDLWRASMNGWFDWRCSRSALDPDPPR